MPFVGLRLYKRRKLANRLAMEAASAGRISPVSYYRQYWLPDLIVLMVLAIVVTAVFWTTDWDLSLAGLFYESKARPDPFPTSRWWLFDLLYRGAPILVGVIAVGTVVAIVVGTLRPARRLVRLYGLFLLLSIIIGPGLVVNMVFKDHWGRPRPRQVEQFGGTMQHLPPLVRGESGIGKSFPCGHCSVGFVLMAFYFILRRRRPGWAALALMAAVSFGLLLGAGRMAAGAHFASDVLWAGIFTFGVCWGLYYFVLNIPAREDAFAAGEVAGVPRPKLVIGSSVALGLLVIAGVLLASPESRDIHRWVTTEQLNGQPASVALELSRGNVDVFLVNKDEGIERVVEVTGRVRGFGLPTNKIRDDLVFSKNEKVVTYTLAEEGFFTELTVELDVHIDASELKQLRLRTGKGNIAITIDETVTSLPELDVRSEEGEVRLPKTTELKSLERNID